MIACIIRWSAGTALLLIAIVNAADSNIDFKQYTVDFKRTIASGPNIRTGATPREVAAFYITSLDQLGYRIEAETTADSRRIIEVNTKKAEDYLTALRNDTLKLNQALKPIQLLSLDNWLHIRNLAGQVNEIMTPLMRRGLRQFSRLSAADAEHVKQVSQLYEPFFTETLPRLNAQTEMRLHLSFINFINVARKTFAAFGSCRLPPLLELTALNEQSLLNEYWELNFWEHVKISDGSKQLLGLK